MQQLEGEEDDGTEALGGCNKAYFVTHEASGLQCGRVIDFNVLSAILTACGSDTYVAMDEVQHPTRPPSVHNPAISAITYFSCSHQKPYKCYQWRCEWRSC